MSSTTIAVVGLSAQAIAGSGQHHPHDPADLRRCLDYCRGRISVATLRNRMAGRSLAWDRLLPHWEYLGSLLEEELRTRTDQRAPRTYVAMQRILADGHECSACAGTGRGAECGGCVGTGRRGRGQCRAANCWRGAAPCITCQGRGYTARPPHVSP